MEIENCEPHLSCFYSLSYPSTSDHLIVWKVVSEVADCAESISRVSLDGSDAITRPTMIHRYGIPSDTILTASKQLQPIVRSAILSSFYSLYSDTVITMRHQGSHSSIFSKHLILILNVIVGTRMFQLI